ncbi:MAG: iron-containing alcohol dehydrogenase [Pseudomonadota bacterium]
MTLITYSTRIHFADSVLEEALWAEVEASGLRRAMLVARDDAADLTLLERIPAGLPPDATLDAFEPVPAVPTEVAARALAARIAQERCDAMIAVGGSAAIGLAKLARLLIKHDVPLGQISALSSAIRRDRPDPALPKLFAIPALRGLGAAVNAHVPVILEDGERSRVIHQDLIPTVTICDPSLLRGEADAPRASALVEAIARCIEAYLLQGFHPPAEGIALDGLRRASCQLPRHGQGDQFEVRRELMAATLNGALALQTGLGVSQRLCDALRMAAHRDLDNGAVTRLLLPPVLRCLACQPDPKHRALKRALGIYDETPLADGVAIKLQGLPLPRRLSECGIDQAAIESAASIASNELYGQRQLRLGGEAGLSKMMRALH